MKIGALIPAYNEEEKIAWVVKKTLPFVQEVLVINDGSRDRTEDRAKKAGAKVINHLQRKGKGEALKTGFDYLLNNAYQAIITLDGDGQHNPDEIPSFLKKAKEKRMGMVIGCRQRNIFNMRFDRFLTNWFTSSAISLLCSQRIPDSQCGFRLINGETLRKIRLQTSHFDTESEMILKIARKGFRIESVPIDTVYKKEKSKIRPLPDTLRFFKFLFLSLFIKNDR